MTPEEKARELFDKIYKLDNKAWYNVAKQCALIAVDEIISMQEQVNIKFDFNIKYWQEVKQEIENL